MFFVWEKVVQLASKSSATKVGITFIPPPSTFFGCAVCVSCMQVVTKHANSEQILNVLSVSLFWFRKNTRCTQCTFLGCAVCVSCMQVVTKRANFRKNTQCTHQQDESLCPVMLWRAYVCGVLRGERVHCKT